MSKDSLPDQSAPKDLDVQSHRRAHLWAGAITSVIAMILGFVWFIVLALAYFAEGGTMGGYGAAATTGDAYVWWAGPARWLATLAPLIICPLVYLLIYTWRTRQGR